MIEDVPKPWLPIAVALLSADIAAAFETMMIFAALKELYGVFRDPIGVGWLVTSYLLVAAAAGAVCGRLGDIFGRKRLILILLALAAVGSAVSALSPSLGWMIAGRALQGMSGAVIPLSYGIVREHVRADRTPLVGGLVMSGGAIGTVLGVVLGGLVIDHGGWQHLFWLSGAFALASFAMIWLLAPRDGIRTARAEHLDVVGGLLFVPAAVLLMLTVSNLRSWWPGDIRLIGSLAIAAALLVWWVRHELRHPHPLIDLRLLRQRGIVVPNLCIVIASLGGIQLTMVIMLYLQQPVATGIGLGLGAAVAGALKVPANIGSTLIAPLAGHLSRGGRTRWVMFAGFALNCAAWALLLLATGTLPIVVAAIVMSTLGTTMVYVAVANAITLRAPAGQISEAMGVSTFLRSIATALGAQVVTSLLAIAVVGDPAKPGATLPAPSAYLLVFGAILVLSVFGAIVATRSTSAVRA